MHTSKTMRKPSRRSWVARCLAMLLAGVAGCGPGSVPFPMPEEFPQPIDTQDSLPALACPDIAARADSLEPETSDWARDFRNALFASAARTLILNPEAAAVGDDAAVATGNPWGLSSEVLSQLQDEAYWVDLCDSGQGEPGAYAEFTEMMFETDSMFFLNDLLTMSEPALEPYEDLL